MRYRNLVYFVLLILVLAGCAKERNPLAPIRNENFISADDIMFSGNAMADTSGHSWGEFSFVFSDDTKELFAKYFYAKVSDVAYPDTTANYTTITNIDIRVYNQSDKVFTVENGSLNHSYSTANKSGGDVLVNSIGVKGYTPIQNVKYPDIEMTLNYNNGVENLPVGSRYYNIYIIDLYGNINVIKKKISPVVIYIESYPYYNYVDIHNITTWPNWYVSLGSMGEIVSSLNVNECKVKVLISMRDLMELAKGYGGFDTNAIIVKSFTVSDGVNMRTYTWNNFTYDDGNGHTVSDGGNPIIVTFR